MGLKIKLSIFFLYFIGLLMIYSASNVVALYKYNDSLYFFKRQLIYGIIGFILLIIASKIDLKILKKYAFIIFIICLIPLILVLIIGSIRGGARSWIDLKIILFQPSELIKVALIILLARLMSIKFFDFYDFLFIMIFVLLVLFLIILEPDLGQALVILISFIFILFISKIKMKYFIYLFLILGVLSILLITIAPYRINRIKAYINPWDDALGVGFQSIQSIYAISSGIFGLGFNKSRQKYFYLPEPQTDFIFSIVIEELGLFGGSIIIFIFLYLIINIFKLAIKQDDLFNMYLLIGINSLFLTQVFINLGVVTTLLPITGITLPFFSYGGSSLIINFIMMGLVINIQTKTKYL